MVCRNVSLKYCWDVTKLRLDPFYICPTLNDVQGDWYSIIDLGLTFCLLLVRDTYVDVEVSTPSQLSSSIVFPQGLVEGQPVSERTHYALRNQNKIIQHARTNLFQSSFIPSTTVE